MSSDRPGMTEQRKAYADLLDVLVKVGLVLVGATCVPYVLGTLAPTVPVERSPEVWSLPLAEYLARTGARTGVRWLQMLRHADFLPLAGIAFLAAATIVCYLRIVPIFAAKKMTAYLVIALLQVAVLLLAASGVLAAGAG